MKMSNADKANKVSNTIRETIDISRLFDEDLDDDVMKILQYMDEVANRKKSDAPILTFKTKNMPAG